MLSSARHKTKLPKTEQLMIGGESGYITAAVAVLSCLSL
jgi:hypothetical protein